MWVNHRDTTGHAILLCCYTQLHLHVPESGRYEQPRAGERFSSGETRDLKSFLPRVEWEERYFPGTSSKRDPSTRRAITHAAVNLAQRFTFYFSRRWRWYTGPLTRKRSPRLNSRDIDNGEQPSSSLLIARTVDTPRLVNCDGDRIVQDDVWCTWNGMEARKLFCRTGSHVIHTIPRFFCLQSR